MLLNSLLHTPINKFIIRKPKANAINAHKTSVENRKYSGREFFHSALQNGLNSVPKKLFATLY